MNEGFLSSSNKKTQKIKQTKVFLNTTPSLFTKKPTKTHFYQILFILFILLIVERKRRFLNTIQ